MRSRFVAAAAVLFALQSSAWAQAAPAAEPKPAAKPAAKAPSKPAAKKPARSTTAKAAAAAVPVLAAASQEQLNAAERTFYGPYACEFNQSLDVGINKTTPGYVDVQFQNRTFTMKPVLSSTGALRLEDVRGQALLLQIANKSMLMDVKAGRRLVDECVHEKQRNAVVSTQKLMD